MTERVKGFKTGRGTEDGVTIGPLIDDAPSPRPTSSSTTPCRAGATVRIGGEAIDGPGTFYAATVLDDVAPGSDILREEIFGPVLAIVSFDDEDEAVRSPTTPSTGWSPTSTPRASPAGSA